MSFACWDFLVFFLLCFNVDLWAGVMITADLSKQLLVKRQIMLISNVEICNEWLRRISSIDIGRGLKTTVYLFFIDVMSILCYINESKRFIHLMCFDREEFFVYYGNKVDQHWSVWEEMHWTVSFLFFFIKDEVLIELLLIFRHEKKDFDDMSTMRE